MPPQKPRWDWKVKGAAELDHFDIPFAIKEYLQNQVGQILKECDIYAWNDWVRWDLRNTLRRHREARKTRLIADYPGLLTGPHGTTLRKPAWLPVYILSATIPTGDLVKTQYEDELKLCVIVWDAKLNTDDDTVIMGLTFYNNHLDRSADFNTFVVDGASTSRLTNAVGEKGKGFILASQYLHERVEEHCKALEIKPLKAGVSFRVGHQIGELKWKRRRGRYSHLPQLQVVMDDLEPLTAMDLARRWAEAKGHSKKAAPGSEEDASDDGDSDADDVVISEQDLATAEKAVRTMYKRRFTQNLASKAKGLSGDVMEPDDEESNVSEDEVCVTILGLPSLSVETLFSAIYGAMPPPSQWKITDAVTFFKAPGDKPLFYHRDQLVPHPPPLIQLSINYHGPLDISSDRAEIRMGRSPKFHEYRIKVAEAANKAFDTEPDLAQEIALAVLKDTHPDIGATVGRVLSNWLAKKDRTADVNPDTYREAFLAAWRQTHPTVPDNVGFYPHSPNASEDIALIKELGMHPVVTSPLTHAILTASKAYTGVHSYAIRTLLAAPLVQRHVPGYAQLRRGMQYMFKGLDDRDVTMREYQYSFPRAIWDTDKGVFAFSLPAPCPTHKGTGCVCYVGPYLSEAWKDYHKKEKNEEATAGGSNADNSVDVVPTVFQAFMHAFDIRSSAFDVAHHAQTSGAAQSTAGGNVTVQNERGPSNSRTSFQGGQQALNPVDQTEGNDPSRGQGRGLEVAGNADDSDDDLYARNPGPDRVGAALSTHATISSSSMPGGSISSPTKDVEMSDGTSRNRPSNARLPRASSSSNPTTPPAQAEQAEQHSTHDKVATEGPRLANMSTSESEESLEYHLAAIQDIVLRQKDAVETARRQTEARFREDLDSKDKQIQGLQKEVKELQSQVESSQSQLSAVEAAKELEGKELRARVNELEARVKELESDLDEIWARAARSKRPRLD